MGSEDHTDTHRDALNSSSFPSISGSSPFVLLVQYHSTKRPYMKEHNFNGWKGLRTKGFCVDVCVASSIL